MKISKIAPVVGCLLLLTLSVPGALSISNAAQSVNCSSSSILHMTVSGGAPPNFNDLLPPSGSAIIIEHLAFPGLSSEVNPAGVSANDGLANATSNSNYTVWAFHILPGKTWSNGQPVTAQDILNTYSANFTLNPKSDALGAYKYITKLYSNASNTAVFVLNQSNAHFGELIGSTTAETGLYPQSFTSQGSRYHGFGVTIPSSGSFYVQNYTSGSSEVILPSNQYFSPTPKVCEIIMNFVESSSSAVPLLVGGQTDVAPELDPLSAGALQGQSNVRIISTPNDLGQLLLFNDTVYPFNETAFRQALVYGINESEIVQQGLAGYGSAGYSSEGGIPTGTYYNANQQKYSYDPQHALSLLNTMGITRGSNGMLQYPNGTQIPAFTVWTDTSFSDTAPMVQIIQKNLESLGFTVNTQDVSNSIITSYFTSSPPSHGLEGPYAMFLTSTGAIAYGSPLLATLPIYSDIPQFWPTPNGNMYLSPASANSAYWSNETALTGTDNLQLESQYADNIQALQATYLPFITLAYADDLTAISTLHWTNWPSSGLTISQDNFNQTALANIQPVSGVGSVSTTNTQSTQGSVSSTNTQSSQGSLSTTSTQTGQASSNLTIIEAAVAVVVIIVVVGAIFFWRGRRTTK